MFYYFGYGSNLNVLSLRAKGVAPLRSDPAVLEGWRLAFNVPDFFRLEGGTGNIVPSENDEVHGVLHTCRETDQPSLDRLEAVGYKYARRELSVTTYAGARKLVYAYVGLPSILDDSCLPSERYRNILLRGAVDVKLDARYVERLRQVPTLAPPSHGPFELPSTASDVYDVESLADEPCLTALAGVVFDMTLARAEHAYLRNLLGGRDVTLLFLQRMDKSTGTETFDDVRLGRLNEPQRRYLNAYLHEFAREYHIVGRMNYEMSTPSGGYVVLGAPVSLRVPASRRTARASRPPRGMSPPAREVLVRAETARDELGHENFGFLSESSGFMPREPPRLHLPPAFAAWDQASRNLPELYRGLRLRRELDALPVLSAGDLGTLPDEHLLRASAVLAMLSHAYWYVESRPPERLPAGLSRPWSDVRRRLDRGPAVLSYIDLIVYNWRLLDPAQIDPIRLDNMRLLIPTVDTDEERVFYLTQTEILARATPIVGAIARAQEAVVMDDRECLESQLLAIMDCLERIVRESLLNINPNPRGAHHVDPVVWAKGVAPFAVPMEDGIQGPSGTSSPIFNALDIFLGRKKFETFLGREIHQLRGTYPQHWRDFLVATGQVSVPDDIERRGDANLKGLLQETVAIYAGPNGFLGRHRMKVYGYLELAFKVGRSVTIGGFKGVFKDRTWDQVDSELELSRLERTQSFPQSCHHVRVKRVTPSPDGAVTHVVLDIAESGCWYEPGDRCGVLPENGDELVARTLTALGAQGDERVALTPEWREAVRLRWGFEESTRTLSLSNVLRFGLIRPLLPRVAEALHALSQNETLKDQMRDWTTHRAELWDTLEMLRRAGFDPSQLWRSTTAEPSDAICRLLPPVGFRMYSIASTMSSVEAGAEQDLQLTVAHLRYTSAPSGADPSQRVERAGTASSFLANLGSRTTPISIVLQHPPRFSLPRSAKTPIVMIAAGTGVAPFRGFIAERVRQSAAGEAWLFLGLRSRDAFCYHDDFASAVASGKLELRVAFSRDDVDLRFEPGDEGQGSFVCDRGRRRRVEELLVDPENARTLWELLRRPEDGACIYVCGRSPFARAALEALKAIFRRFVVGNEEERVAAAQQLLSKLMAEGRIMLEIFTGHTADDVLPSMRVTDIARHNDERNGYWTIIEGRVFDLTEFVRLHPGGARILQGYAGVDATDAYARSHANRSEIDAMREMYAIGRVRPLALEGVSGVVRGPAGDQIVSLSAAYRAWVKLLYLVVEMQNALRHDHALQDGITTRGDPPRPRSPYKLDRAVETHQRFLRSYLDVLVGDSFPSLWAITQGLFAPEAPREWMEHRLTDIRETHGARYTESVIGDLYDAVHRLVAEEGDGGAFTMTCEILEDEDSRLLADVKACLMEGVAVFEALGHEVHGAGASQVAAACRALPERLLRYYTGLQARLRDADWNPAVSERSQRVAPSSRQKTLLSDVYWVLEEDETDQIVVLRRTPRPFTSVDEIAAASEAVIGSLRPDHRECGVVLDLRQGPGRNDPAFEQAMRGLRESLGERFARVAVLVETLVGVLQIDRLRRSEGWETIATQSETSARRFAKGMAI